jgi:FkbH-like protein
VEIAPPSEIDVPRVSQLTQKTNQFNLTTKRYAEGEIRALAASPDSDVFALKVRDRIADLGLVGVGILRYDGEEAAIDSFLLSCRAIGRGVEDALLAVMVRHALERPGVRRVAGRYARTAKNAMVEEFYPRHGFAARERDADGAAWELTAQDAGALAVPAWIQLRNGEPVHAAR